MRIKSVALFGISLFTMLILQNAWPINCKLARQEWELAVCRNERLMEFDKQMNQEYKLSLKSHKDAANIKSSQKYWLSAVASLDLKDSEALENAYGSRLTTLRTWNFDSQRVHTIGPIIHQDVPYRMIRESLNNRTLLEYPMLVEKDNNQIVNAINSQITDLAKEYLKEAFTAYDCQAGANPEPKFDVFGFSVTASKARLFGMTIGFDPCYCGCTYTEENINLNYLWDLDDGTNIQSILDTPFKIKDDNLPAFWKKIAEYNDMDLNELSKKEDCKGDFIREYRPELSLTEDGIEFNTRGTSGAERFCGDVYTIPYSQYKAVNLELNPDFIHYLPRFVQAGLISEGIAKEIAG